MMDCLFCRIISHDIPAEILYEGEKAIAILDRFPIHPGHALILPKLHCIDFLHLPADSFQEIMFATQTVADALVRSLNLEGFNVFSNNGRIAGQSVFHFHIHVTPRYHDDAVRFAHGKETYTEGEMAQYGVRIRSSMKLKA
jgi:histidine triad (HIT) family protein